MDALPALYSREQHRYTAEHLFLFHVILCIEYFYYLVPQNTEKFFMWMGGAIGILYTKANYLDSELGLDSVNALLTYYKQDKKKP